MRCPTVWGARVPFFLELLLLMAASENGGRFSNAVSEFGEARSVVSPSAVGPSKKFRTVGCRLLCESSTMAGDFQMRCPVPHLKSPAILIVAISSSSKNSLLCESSIRSPAAKRYRSCSCDAFFVIERSS